MLQDHDRKIERHGNFLFRERHNRMEKERDCCYLEEILADRQDRAEKIEQKLAREKAVQAGGPVSEDGDDRESLSELLDGLSQSKSPKTKAFLNRTRSMLSPN